MADINHRAVELGVNHIDTASFYDGGAIDARIRQSNSGPSVRVRLSSKKCG
ncbi:hypothetical protein H7I02_01355 [Mycolicibacterium brumae]|nr:hypothetical protein [Mycolicibacterium brumae]MCV7191453.1 hypothetical protein [Mycolicibacterium brumae]RWA16165.1 hypothetical protein MBRU_08635 [Mycolicibacterium brumae DSM 44177]UWW09439.1 hypothetical protein L2Z93_002539 [Mycolicibacterium brumae]